jgi:hypothetical protein
MSIIRVLHLVRSLFIVLLFAFSITPAARAQVPVNQYLSLIEDFQFEKLTEISTPEEQVGIGPFSREILDDYILLSYSRWAVQPEAALQSPPLQLDIYEMKDTPWGFWHVLHLAQPFGRGFPGTTQPFCRQLLQ